MTANKTQMPLEASFITLAMSLASATLMSLGLAPDPQTKQTKVNIDLARFNIDLLDMLSKKTKGNLVKEEEEFVTQVLADLKLKFVEVSNREKSSKSI
jgi:hypothetical protein